MVVYLCDHQAECLTHSNSIAGDVATVWPPNATEEQKKKRNCARVEIFKMASGLEYIIHDVDENNHIIGRARFNGHI